MSSPVNLASYDNSWYTPGRSVLYRAAWLLVGLPLFRTSLLPFSNFRVGLLRLFGAKIGRDVVIHSEVAVKYPWHLHIGDNCWIGERVWIDNLTAVTLGRDVCLSQGAYICTGNHDWSDPSFGLIVRPVTLRDGVWVGAKSVVLPGVTLEESSVACAGSVITGSIPSCEIRGGNPAFFLRVRPLHAPHSFADEFSGGADESPTDQSVFLA